MRRKKDRPAPTEPKRKNKRPSRKGTGLPRVTVLDILPDCPADQMMAIPAGWKEADGPAPLVRVETRRNDRAVPAPGERILARILADTSGQASHVARPMKVLTHHERPRLGILHEGPKGAVLVPINRKQKEIPIARANLNGAKDRDLVEVELAPKTRLMVPEGRVINVLGNPDGEKSISMIALHELGIPHRFPAAVLEQARSASPVRPGKREDWTHIPFITIDPASARDHDDAIFAQEDTDPTNPGGHVLLVAIADVAAYVRPGSPMDKEAFNRGNSVYFPDRVVPMLPERISNDLCSLQEGHKRPALAVRMHVDSSGKRIAHSFHRVMISIAAGLTYRQAQDAFDNRPDATCTPLQETVLRPLWNVYQAMAKARDQRGPLDLDLPEKRIILDENGHVERVVVPPRLEANRLVEEFMVAANVCAAQTLEQRKSPLLYRVHDTPGAERLAALKEFLTSLEMNFTASPAVKPADFNRILSRARATDKSIQVSEMVLRSQAQAEYSPSNYGHFGLNLSHYAHFTSPIRRYADLIVHRALISACSLGTDRKNADGLPKMEAGELKAIAEHISMTERRAMMAERQTTDRLIALFLNGRTGARFSARISGVAGAGLFVRLDDTGADGFIPAATLGSDYFRHIPEQQAMVGEKSGERFQLGAPVEVELVEAAPLAGALRFRMLSHGDRTKPPGSTGQGRRPRTKRGPQKFKGKRKR